MILCDKAFISYLTPKLTHYEPFILSGRTATAPTSAFYLLFPFLSGGAPGAGERDDGDDIFHFRALERVVFCGKFI
jgi:hypothetical protein